MKPNFDHKTFLKVIKMFFGIFIVNLMGCGGGGGEVDPPSTASMGVTIKPSIKAQMPALKPPIVYCNEGNKC